MDKNKIFYYEIGDKDNPLYSIQYLEESKTVKKDNKKVSFGWTYQVGQVTNSKNKTLNYEASFSAFDASLEYLFDVLGQSLLNGALGFTFETLSKMNFSITQETKVTSKDKEGKEIIFNISAIGGAIPYSIQIESVDGKKFKGKLPDKIEEYLYKFNDLNRTLKDLKRVPTYDRPKYFYSGLYEEMFAFDKLISEETIEINNEVSKKIETNINSELFLETEYDIDEYHIKEENYQNTAKKKGSKISLGNIEQYQTVTRGQDEIFISNTFSVVEYDPKSLSKHGINAVEHKFLEKASNTLIGNFIKSLNLTFMSNVNTTFKDKNGNIIEAELKLFGGNFLHSMKINKINGQEVTKLPKELIEIVNKYNKPLSGIKYYFNTEIETVNKSWYSKFSKFLLTNYKRTLDSIFDIQDQIKTIDATRTDNLDYVSDYKLNGSDREYQGIKIRTEKGMFTRVDKATFTSSDGHQVEIKISSYLNGLYPTLRINSIDGKKQHAIAPLRVHLKDESIDALIQTAKGVIENRNIEIPKKDKLSDKEKDKLLSITQKQIDSIVSNIVGNMPNIILKEFTKTLSKKATKQINEHLILNASSDNIREIKFDGILTKEIIQGLYNQNPNLETIINNGKRINVMDHIDETLEDKLKRMQKISTTETNELQIKDSKEEQR